MIYRFGPYAMDTDSFTLTGDEGEIAVEPQVFALLQFLIENRERVVSKDEIIDDVWDGRAISDSALNSRVTAARKAVGDDGKSQAVIKTFSRRGFRFVAELAGAQSKNQAAYTDLAGDKPTIAVLPFNNLSGDSEQDYFSDGITEDIIAALSRIRHFFVLARNTTFTFKGQAVDVQAVAKELGVQYVLEGSVRKSGSRIRIAVQLIDGDRGNQLWAEKYDRELEDIFAVQDDITRTVVGALEPELTDAEIRKSQRKAPENFTAWDCYLKGLAHFYGRTQKDILQALDYFERAIEMEPALGVAYAGAAQAHSFMSIIEAWELSQPDRDNDEHLEAGLKLALKSVELDDNDANAWVVLGLVHTRRREHEKAIRALERALAINSSESEAYRWLGSALLWSGEAAKALPNIETALKLSPSGPLLGPTIGRLADCHFFMGEFEQAVTWAKRSLQEPTTRWLVNMTLISALGHLERYEEATAEIDTVLDAHPGFSFASVQNIAALADADYINSYREGLLKAGFPET